MTERQDTVSKLDVSTLLLPLEYAAHAMEGVDDRCSDDASFQTAVDWINRAIFIVEKLSGTTFDAIECSDEVNARCEELQRA